MNSKLEIGKIKFCSLCDSCLVTLEACHYNKDRKNNKVLFCEDYKKEAGRKE